MNPSLRYAKHDDIDPDKWDECVSNASNGLIYAYSFYLDHLAKNWDGLILGDYEAVMPLPWNKKYGVHYLYQPPFVASGGVFGNNLTESLTAEFIQLIPKKFRLIEINLNAGNIFSAPSGFQHLRTNYVLDLNTSYDELRGNYRDNVKRNIKKATEVNCKIKTGIPVQDVLIIAKEQLSSVVKMEDHDLQQFEKLYHFLHERSQAITYGVYNANNELLASCVYFFSHNRAYYILVGNHPNGKTLGASHYLIDRFIADYAGQNIMLDFEGSDIRNLAFFYESFGAKTEIYPALKIDRLPWYVRVLR
jgi:hypothetical protein